MAIITYKIFRLKFTFDKVTDVYQQFRIT